MAAKEIRIKLKDFDPSSEIMILEDVKGLLSPLMMSLEAFNKWRIDEHRNTGSRIQMYMTFVKQQGGKQTILEQVERTRDAKYYKEFNNNIG